MTDKEKLEKIKSLADKMYNAAFNLTIDASLLRKAMDDYRQFIINEHNKEEPVSEDLEKASYLFACKCHPLKTECSTSSPNREVIEAFKTGAKWQKTKDEFTTEDLGEYISELSKQFPEVSFAKLSRIAVRVAKWQMAQMIKDATDVTVHVDAGGYPYIPQMELYDYDKDIPLAKGGDKYKVVLIKEG